MLRINARLMLIDRTPMMLVGWYYHGIIITTQNKDVGPDGGVIAPKLVDRIMYLYILL